MGSPVSLTMRIDDEVKEVLKRLAEQENRSMASYVELLVTMERDRLANEQFTLKDVIEAVNHGNHRILEKMDSIPKAKKAAKPKSSPMDCELPEDLNGSSWKDWIQHLHRCDIHFNQYQAQKHADKFAEYSEDYDVNILIERLIKDCAKTVYIPFDWKDKPKKPWA